MDADAQLDPVLLLPCFPLWGPFENARWALPWCPSENALNGRRGTVGPCVPLSNKQLLDLLKSDAVFFSTCNNARNGSREAPNVNGGFFQSENFQTGHFISLTIAGRRGRRSVSATECQRR